MLLKGLAKCSREPLEDNKLFTFSKGERNRKSSLVPREIQVLEEVALCVTQNTSTVDLCFHLGH